MPVHTATLDFTVGYMSSGTCQGTKDVAVNPLLRSTTFSKINNKKKTGVVKNSKIKNSYREKRKKKKIKINCLDFQKYNLQEQGENEI